MSSTSPLILLHGFAGTPAVWDDVLAAWPGGAPPARALALPGHGAPAPASWDDALDHLAAAVPADATVIGYSLGARLTLGLVARGVVTRAVLVSVNPGLPADDHAGRAARRAADAGWAAQLRAVGMAAFLDAWERQPVLASGLSAPAERLARRRPARLALDPEALARALETLGLAEMPDYRDALAAAAPRLHLVVGGADTKFAALAAAAQARSPGLPVDVLDGVGHDPTLEAPAALAGVLAAAVG